MILLISDKETYASSRIMEECMIRNLKIKIVNVEQMNLLKNIKPYSLLYIRNVFFNKSPKFLPDVIELAKEFRQTGKRVVDTNIAEGFLARGKLLDYEILKIFRVRVPETTILTENLARKHYAFFRNSGLEKPIILKWIYGMRAKNVFLVKNEHKLEMIYNCYPKGELMLQEYIKADYEYKVITVGYRSLPVVVKFEIQNSKFQINFKTGKALNVKDVNPCIVELAEKASKILGRELAKVDILEKDGQFYVLEVNRCPGLKSFEKISNFNVAAEFVKYLQK